MTTADPRDDRLVLAVDLGTGGPKVGFVSVTGRVAWQDHVAVGTQWLSGGGAVQDPAEWWRIISEAVRRGLASDRVNASQVVAVAVTGQWASTVPVDASGLPVGPCIMWMDTRGGRHVGPIIGGPVAGYAPRPAATWIRRTGAAPSPAGGDPIGHMLFLTRDCPEVAAQARWYLEPVDYLSMRFTGVAAASPASMTAAWLTDNRQLDRLAYDDELLRLSSVDPSKLPPLVATGSVIGTLCDAAATELGLPAAVQVVTGTPDLHSGAFGAGAVGDFEAHMTVSTTSWISAPVPFKKTDIVHSIASIPGVAPGRYLIVNNQDTAGRALQWLRDTLGVGDYDSLMATAATARPGAGGVIFTPWLNGERSPIDDRKARGGFHNLSLGTTQADLIRAVAEGVAYNSRWLHIATEKFAKRRLDDIRLFGGGAVSDMWCQILADVLDRTVERVEEPLHAGIRGAALFAGVSLGDVELKEVRSLVRVDRRFSPQPGNRAVYDRLYAEFPKLYRAQKGMFARLNGKSFASG
jgi:xylulokinase